ncbi:MAG: hypothetical protein E6G49_03535 [Actinobacteria bacterium]|nr:MAG: hypothetical protein E6G49_03535 [Actinomycetota bacterium]
MSGRRLLTAALGLVSTGAFAISPAAATASEVSAAAGRGEIPFTASTDISGAVTGHPGGDGGVTVDLQADPYPYGSFATQDSQATAADGSYRFGVTPARNTRYRVVLKDTPAVRSDTVAVTADEKVTTSVKYETPGRARITIQSRHPADLNWGGKRVRWYLSPGSRGKLHRVESGHTSTPRPACRPGGSDSPRASGRSRWARWILRPRDRAAGATGSAAGHAPCMREPARRRSAIRTARASSALGVTWPTERASNRSPW